MEPEIGANTWIGRTDFDNPKSAIELNTCILSIAR